MDINKIQSDLRMRDFFFKECSVKRNQFLEDGDINVNLDRKITKTEEHVFDVLLTLTVGKEDLEIIVIAQATFTLETTDYSMENEIINVNTVAIMFPFIRSEVTLLTSQPGMQPIVLPAINTSKFK